MGFAAGAFGSAWRTYQAYREPWQKLRIEHEGVKGKPGHTRVVVENPKMPVQVLELSSNGEGVPTGARITLREGEELVMTFDDQGRAASLTGPDGAVARYAY